MKNLSKNARIAIVSALVFVLFVVCFFALSSAVQNGMIEDFELSPIVEIVILDLMCFPFLLSLFYFGRLSEDKGKYPIATLLKFASIGLFALVILQTILTLLGVYS